jgi:hypothetical protein
MCVQAHARVCARHACPRGTAVELELWCDTADRLVVAAGTASCIQP